MESFGAPGLFRTQAIAVEQDFACQEVVFNSNPSLQGSGGLGLTQMLAFGWKLSSIGKSLCSLGERLTLKLVSERLSGDW
jgi:hypothetical protein